MATDNELQQQMDELRQAVQGLAAASQDAEKGLEAFGKATWKGVKSIGPGLGSLAKQVGEGDTSFKSMNKVVDIAANALGGMAKAIPFAGDALSATLKATAEAAKFLLDQMDQATKSFNSMAEVGALTADGMQGVLDQSNATGLALTSWTKLVQTNSMALARMSGIAGDGAKVFSEAVGKLTQGNDDSLRMLGMNAEQIGETVGAFASQQTRLGRSQSMTADQLALGAKEYAMELDQLQKVTGMSRDAIQKQQDSALSESRFRANYEDLMSQGKQKEAKALMALQTSMSGYSKELGQGTRDLVSGAANTEAAKQLMNQTNGAAQDIIARVKSGEIDQDQAERELQAAMKNNKETMLQHAKVVDGNSEAYGNVAGSMDFMNRDLEKSADKAKTTQEAQLSAQDKLTKDTIEAQKNIERMGMEVQKMTIKALPYAAKAVEKVSDALAGLTKFINAMIGGDSGGEAPTATTGMDMGGAEIMTAGEAELTPAEQKKHGATATGKPTGGAAGAAPNDKALTGKSLSGVNEGLASALKAAASEYMSITGKTVAVTSAVRTPEEQQRLYDDYKAGRSKFPAAPPGKSNHAVGNAVDIDSSTANEMAQKGILAKYGLGQTVAKDPVHIQQISAASGAVLSGPSGGYSPGLTMHGTEAIVPIDTPESSPINLGGGNTEMMTMQLARLEELASIFKSQLSVDQKLLQYSS
jgi:hypothetical protein